MFDDLINFQNTYPLLKYLNKKTETKIFFIFKFFLFPSKKAKKAKLEGRRGMGIRKKGGVVREGGGGGDWPS